MLVGTYFPENIFSNLHENNTVLAVLVERTLDLAIDELVSDVQQIVEVDEM